MPLNHVYMWSEHGWKPITIKELDEMHPEGTISAYSGLLMCGICGQFVTRAAGDKYVHYFKHDKKEASKLCEERAKQYDAGIISLSREHDLPIRLASFHSIELEIGLLPIPKDISLNTRQQIIIIPKDSEDKSFLYSLSRIHRDCITYLPIGTSPASEYHIFIRDKIPFWPSKVQGIPTEGALFHGKTRKKIPYDADVQVNCDYYLLTTRIENVSDNGNITVQEIVPGYPWRLYRVRAVKMTRYAGNFFLRFHCRLTDNPVEIFPIWPVTIQTPYFIHHNKNELFMFLQGEAKAKVFPSADMNGYPCGNGKVIKVNCHDRQQLLCVGRTKILRYTYFWKDMLNNQAEIPAVTVTDFYGQSLKSGIKQEIPKKSQIKIKSEYDGFAEIEKDNKLLERRRITAEQQTIIQGIQFGYHIKIFQGLDCVWEILYERHKKEINCDERAILAKLNVNYGKRIRVPHALGATAEKLKNYPRVRQWLYQRIREGYMSEKAYRVFTDFIAKI